MNKERRVNQIKALKAEISFYKRQLIPMNIIIPDKLEHIKLSTAYEPEEVDKMPKDEMSELVICRMTDAFRNAIMQLPIETEFDEQFHMYKATLDLWVKQNRRY